MADSQASSASHMVRYSLISMLLGIAAVGGFMAVLVQAGFRVAIALAFYVAGCAFCLAAIKRSESTSDSLLWILLTIVVMALALIISGLLEPAVF